MLRARAAAERLRRGKKHHTADLRHGHRHGPDRLRQEGGRRHQRRHQHHQQHGHNARPGKRAQQDLRDQPRHGQLRRRQRADCQNAAHGADRVRALGRRARPDDLPPEQTMGLHRPELPRPGGRGDRAPAPVRGHE